MVTRKIKLTDKRKLPALKQSYDERALYPWMDIRNSYIEGYEDEDGVWIWPSAANLGERFNTPETSISNRMSKERWVEHRKAHQNAIAVQRQKEHTRLLAEKAVKFDAQAVETAIFANNLIQQRLEELVGLQELMLRNRAILEERVNEGEFVTPGQLKASAISGAELESLSKAFALFNETGRKALGIKDGETPQTFNNTIEIHQVSIREELSRPDEDKTKAILSLFSNPNFSLSQFAQKPKEIETYPFDGEKSDVVEADVVDD